MIYPYHVYNFKRLPKRLFLSRQDRRIGASHALAQIGAPAVGSGNGTAQVSSGIMKVLAYDHPL